MTGSGKLDSFSEGQYWFREVDQIVKQAREEAEGEGITIPADFAHSDRWWKAEAEIEKAMGAGDYIKTRDLSRAYVLRAINYCLTWVDKQRAKIAQKEAA
jgi:hypothetical protein